MQTIIESIEHIPRKLKEYETDKLKGRYLKFCTNMDHRYPAAVAKQVK